MRGLHFVSRVPFLGYIFQHFVDNVETSSIPQQCADVFTGEGRAYDEWPLHPFVVCRFRINVPTWLATTVVDCVTLQYQLRGDSTRKVRIVLHHDLWQSRALGQVWDVAAQLIILQIDLFQRRALGQVWDVAAQLIILQIDLFQRLALGQVWDVAAQLIVVQ